MKDDHLDKPERRRFLKGVVATGGGAAVVALTSNAGTTEPAAVPETESPTKRKGYRLTPHIRHYYETLRS